MGYIKGGFKWICKCSINSVHLTKQIGADTTDQNVLEHPAGKALNSLPLAKDFMGFILKHSPQDEEQLGEASVFLIHARKKIF